MPRGCPNVTSPGGVYHDEIDKAAAEQEAPLAGNLGRRLEQIEEAMLRLGEVGGLRRELDPPPAGRNRMFAVGASWRPTCRASGCVAKGRFRQFRAAAGHVD
jgi:hypothetical protein